jgi:hypothetical protein
MQRYSGQCVYMKEKINAYKVLVGSLKRRLGICKLRHEGNNKMDIKEI